MNRRDHFLVTRNFCAGSYPYGDSECLSEGHEPARSFSCDEEFLRRFIPLRGIPSVCRKGMNRRDRFFVAVISAAGSCPYGVITDRQTPLHDRAGLQRVQRDDDRIFGSFHLGCVIEIPHGR